MSLAFRGNNGNARLKLVERHGGFGSERRNRPGDIVGADQKHYGINSWHGEYITVDPRQNALSHPIRKEPDTGYGGTDHRDTFRGEPLGQKIRPAHILVHCRTIAVGDGTPNRDHDHLGRTVGQHAGKTYAGGDLLINAIPVKDKARLSRVPVKIGKQVRYDKR
ncbi:hypothetical protein JHX88_19880 [Paracoccus saliphilus]|uniref:Uncharacterized protein n=1 Tax=Paracoccus saliphilus TaxID=405559 RepID=A0ABY7SFT9_9RHOB|nr:hypothetical protein [Paracoccus saliphilus]WCR05453.1 hypothetical protein JHX88_19880 [Paracoccus saliphilus]